MPLEFEFLHVLKQFVIIVVVSFSLLYDLKRTTCIFFSKVLVKIDNGKCSTVVTLDSKSSKINTEQWDKIYQALEFWFDADLCRVVLSVVSVFLECIYLVNICCSALESAEWFLGSDSHEFSYMLLTQFVYVFPAVCNFQVSRWNFCYNNECMLYIKSYEFIISKYNFIQSDPWIPLGRAVIVEGHDMCSFCFAHRKWRLFWKTTSL